LKIKLDSITHPAVRTFYALYWQQHQILREFFETLPEEHYDYHMVDTPERIAESPRESIAHILYVHRVFFEAIKTGKLEYRSLGMEHFSTLPKSNLLHEWEQIDTEVYAYLNAETYRPESPVEVPWGGSMGGLDLLFFLRDHDILHIGWNLAYMDHLNLPRYPSLIQYWG
jgi:hypothetical protein